MGKVRAQQGFFVVERGCPTCRGSGEVIADPCRACEGEGRTIKRRKLAVNIPAGVDEGTRIRVSGEGEAGVRSASSGDLYIFVHMKRHAIYSREGTTLVAECPVSVTTAALGGTISLPGIDGGKVDLKIPAGTQGGQRFRMSGRGAPTPAGTRGDLIVEVKLVLPAVADERSKELMREFGRLNGEDVRRDLHV